MKLEERQSYIFTVIKSIRFEGKDFYLFEGPDRKRYLLPGERYANYNINPGDSVTCRIDKINCKGEVFLEPEHPFYRENQTYSFEVAGFDTRVDRAGNKHRVVVVRDIFGQDIPVPLLLVGKDNPVKGEKIKLKIGRIAKGNIRFEGVKSEYHTDKEEDERIVEFIINEKIKGLDGREYYLVSDVNGTDYTIPSDYYAHYGLRIGHPFPGRFVRYKAGEEVRVEPVNPFYTPGQNYRFILKEVIELTGSNSIISVVTDKHGFSHNVDGRIESPPGSDIVLRVERIRKGWPLLKSM